MRTVVEEYRIRMDKYNLTLRKLAAFANFRRVRGRVKAKCLLLMVITTSARMRARGNGTPADCSQPVQRKLNQSIAPKNVYLFFRRLVSAPHKQTEISVLSASRWDVSALCALSTNGRLVSASFHFPVISTLHPISTDNEIISLLGRHHFEIEAFYFYHFRVFLIYLSSVAVSPCCQPTDTMDHTSASSVLSRPLWP